MRLGLLGGQAAWSCVTSFPLKQQYCNGGAGETQRHYWGYAAKGGPGGESGGHRFWASCILSLVPGDGRIRMALMTSRASGPMLAFRRPIGSDLHRLSLNSQKLIVIGRLDGITRSTFGGFGFGGRSLLRWMRQVPGREGRGWAGRSRGAANDCV